MESRFLVLFLTLAIGVISQTGCGRNRVIDETAADQPPVIEPEIDRRTIERANIDTEDFEVGIFMGQMSIEDFGVDNVFGATLAYHITEGFFVELGVGQTEAGLTSFERLSGAAQLLTDDQREYTYYDLSLGYNIFPGESFVGKGRAMNTALYLIGGVGSTTFAGDDRFTVNIGLGFRIMPLDWLAIHADVKDHLFDLDLLGEEKTTHNLSAHLGLTFFF
jgi:outer membrane beta-barrel protein